MDFASDNVAGAAPEILEAIVVSARTRAPAYGNDNWSKRAEAKLAEIFETPVAAFLVATGTGANALALGALTPPWGAIFCHEEAHVIDDECGAPELFSAGAKMVGVPGYGGKLTVQSLEETLHALSDRPDQNRAARPDLDQPGDRGWTGLFASGSRGTRSAGEDAKVFCCIWTAPASPTLWSVPARCPPR